MFTVEVNDTKIQQRLMAMPANVKQAIVHEVTGLRLKLEALVKHKLSGDVLKVVTGALRRSIFSDQKQTASEVEGRVGQSADVPYGKIHEFGGKTGAHDILPSKAGVLAFVMGGKLTFATVVHHPGSVIPERSYLRSSLKDMRDEITGGLKRAALEGVHR